NLAFNKRSKLFPGIVLKRIHHRHKIDVLTILLSEKIKTTFLYPAAPRRRTDLVRIVKHRMIRRKYLHRDQFVRHAVPTNLGRIRTILRLVELRLVVLNDNRSTPARIIEEPLIVSA